MKFDIYGLVSDGVAQTSNILTNVKYTYLFEQKRHHTPTLKDHIYQTFYLHTPKVAQNMANRLTKKLELSERYIRGPRDLYN